MTEKDKSDNMFKIRQKLQEYLHINKLRYTQERFVLLEAIYEADAPLSATDLSRQMLEKSCIRISRATVYNNLKLFESAGLIRKMFLNNQFLYEGSEKNHGVIRLICVGCGKIKLVNNDRLGRLIEGMKTGRFTMTGWALSTYGMCGKCATLLKKKGLNSNKQKDKKR